MDNSINTKQELVKPIEKAIKVLDNLTVKETAIVRQEILEHYNVDLKKFFPQKIDERYASSPFAFEVQEGKLYDLSLKPYSMIALTFPEERKSYRSIQRFLVLYKCDLIFKLFVEIRALNAKIISRITGIWAYTNDSELYNNREMAGRMIKKLETEKEALMKARGGTIFALQAASIKSNVTAEAMEYLLKELELPKF